MKTILPIDKKFADKYLETSSLKESALATYNVLPEKASLKGHDIMKKQAVRDYIESQAMGAITRIVKLSCKSKNEMVKLSANKDILDRAGFKPQEAAININVPLYLPAEIMEKYQLNNNDQINTSPETNN